MKLVAAGITILSLLRMQPAFSQSTQDLQSLVTQVHRDVEEIRGLKFKREIKAQNQSVADFGDYLDSVLELQIPDRLAHNYGRIVRKLGLYRGPEIQDLRSMAKKVMQTQAAAYYDPQTEAFYVVMQELPSQMMTALYAHELYHGLQDQHYDLKSYVLSQFEDLNDDELLARQAVVEGEATYIMNLWSLKKTLGAIPEGPLLEMSIRMQTQLDVEKIRGLLQGGGLSEIAGNDLGQAVQSLDEIPPFMLETLVGAYLKGMGFVFAIQKQGWEQVEKLYERPPVSSEQILHPEKWLSNEIPSPLQWPAFEDQKVFADWSLLEANTVGEIQWRIIFTEHGLDSTAVGASSGWNGDVFAVLEDSATKQLMLLVYSSWDTEADAAEFSSTYQDLLKVKYPDGSEPTSLQRFGRDVLVVEGAPKELVRDIENFMRRAKQSP
jgi:hypothetical protein